MSLVEFDLIPPSVYEFSIPPTAAQTAGINLKTQPLEAIDVIRKKGEVFGHLHGLNNFYAIFPAKPYFPKEGGTHLFIAPVYDHPVKYNDVEEMDLIRFWDTMLPLIRDGVNVLFHDAGNEILNTSQTLGSLHFQAVRFPRRGNTIDASYRIAETREPFDREINAFLDWHFSRPNYSGYLDRWGATIDNTRRDKTGYPSGGIVFKFDNSTPVTGTRIHGFISDVITAYRALHDYIFSTMVIREGYVFNRASKGVSVYPRVLPAAEAQEEMKRFFFSKFGFPQETSAFFHILYNRLSEGHRDIDLVMPFSIGVVQEMGQIEVILDPHFFKKGGSVEMFGHALKRTVSADASLQDQYQRAHELAKSIGIVPLPNQEADA